MEDIAFNKKRDTAYLVGNEMSIIDIDNTGKFKLSGSYPSGYGSSVILSKDENVLYFLGDGLQILGINY